MQQQVYIFINPHCHQQRGWKRWLSIKSDVLRQHPGAVEIVTEDVKDLEIHLNKILQSPEPSCFISAGGDGSIHALVNILLHARDIGNKQILLGAIGLGSSNDFLK